VFATKESTLVMETVSLAHHVAPTQRKQTMAHVFVMQVLRTIMEFVQNALKEPYGVHLQTNAYSSVGRTLLIPQVLQLVSAILDMGFMEDRVKIAHPTTLFQTDIVLLALLMLPTTLPRKLVNVQVDSSLISGEFAQRNAVLMKSTTLQLKAAHVSLDLEK
jgi:hypothetical protein